MKLTGTVNQIKRIAASKSRGGVVEDEKKLFLKIQQE